MGINSGFNFVVFASDDEFYKIAYNDIISADNVMYISKQTRNKGGFVSLLHKLHFSSKINSYIELPFKELWNSQYFVKKFNNDKPICFIFFSNWIKTVEHGFVDFLKSKYPTAKFVCYFQDLIKLKKNLNLGLIKNKFDILMTFDHKESEIYNIFYYPLVYSDYPLNFQKKTKPSEVYFVGFAKNRLPSIIEAYEKLTENDINCNFFLAKVPKQDQVYKNDIKYISEMGYLENLEHIHNTKCLLEIMQVGGHGYTLRMCEAIVYNKKMLTNNPEVINAPFYNKELISTFKDSSNIDIDFLRNEITSVDYNFKEQISPIKMLEFIQEKLKINF
jgi:hypothetical protein